ELPLGDVDHYGFHHAPFSAFSMSLASTRCWAVCDQAAWHSHEHTIACAERLLFSSSSSCGCLWMTPPIAPNSASITCFLPPLPSDSASSCCGLTYWRTWTKIHPASAASEMSSKDPASNCLSQSGPSHCRIFVICGSL